ncbi:FHA domain-containing protein [Synechococcus sp. PCC 6312]|uniref:FHA domain-containing protein n=1 Tax=Synechococcus sp. (strain ATCC 27167 / PCC 6312) TaxID=195253 RepID=UPI00029F0187|nr:FHA domain-containing protein [Synechococcus sp. PCC 6312]AFY61275.1 protein kinase domain with FHA domain [Synechococcus sp. PCC 6312]
MITLTLLHPVQATPVQSWTFEHESVVRIGRAVDNHVVLYSAVVSRHHVELRRSGLHWEVVNLGTNGTYLDGKRVQQASLNDGGILRLARSGPNIQIRIGASSQPPPPNARMDTMPERGTIPEQYVDPAKMTIGGVQTEAETRPQGIGQSQTGEEDDEESDRKFHVAGDLPLEFLGEYQGSECQHPHKTDTDLFCPDCGSPLQVQKTLGPYKVVWELAEEGRFLAWRAGRTVVLQALSSQANMANRSTFRHQARQLCQLDHPSLPKFYEAFAVDGQSYLSAEMVYGQNLEVKVKEEGALELAEVCQRLRPICELLDRNHREHPPLIHQHIQPSNFISALLPRPGSAPDSVAGEWVLVGWGHVAVTTAETGTMMSNMGYLPPEQQAGQVQPASDLYGLGATLVYLLTGYEPDAYFRWGVKEYRLYAEDIPRLNPAIADVINTLTDPNPAARFSSATQAIEQLITLI